MELATTIALVALRGPVPLAKTLAALDLLSGGRLIAGVGPGSAERDYDAIGVPFNERWKRFDEAVAVLRALLRGESPPPEARRHYSVPAEPLTPASRRPGDIPLWIGSWGSKAGLRRVARLGDGWLASAYNTTPETFRTARRSLSEQLQAQGRDPTGFPNAVVTMWTWITESADEADRVLRDVVHRPARALRRRRLRTHTPLATQRRATPNRARGDSGAPGRRRVSRLGHRYPCGAADDLVAVGSEKLGHALDALQFEWENRTRHARGNELVSQRTSRQRAVALLRRIRRAGTAA